jgi:hypothetical protein
MRTRVRKIIVADTEFVYTIGEIPERSEEEASRWHTVVRIFRKGFKATPLEIHFVSVDDYYSGNSLTGGITNLHRPSIIRKLIEFGLKKWNWNIAGVKITDGFEILDFYGYCTDSIKFNKLEKK